jgi:hypothetical protein
MYVNGPQSGKNHQPRITQQTAEKKNTKYETNKPQRHEENSGHHINFNFKLQPQFYYIIFTLNLIPLKNAYNIMVHQITA